MLELKPRNAVLCRISIRIHAGISGCSGMSVSALNDRVYLTGNESLMKMLSSDLISSFHHHHHHTHTQLQLVLPLDTHIHVSAGYSCSI